MTWITFAIGRKTMIKKSYFSSYSTRGRTLKQNNTSSKTHKSSSKSVSASKSPPKKYVKVSIKKHK